VIYQKKLPGKVHLTC